MRLGILSCCRSSREGLVLRQGPFDFFWGGGGSGLGLVLFLMLPPSFLLKLLLSLFFFLKLLFLLLLLLDVALGPPLLERSDAEAPAPREAAGDDPVEHVLGGLAMVVIFAPLFGPLRLLTVASGILRSRVVPPFFDLGFRCCCLVAAALALDDVQNFLTPLVLRLNRDGRRRRAGSRRRRRYEGGW